MSRKAPGLWRSYADRYRPAWKTIVLTSTASVAQAAIGLPIAYLLKQLFDATLRSAWALAGIVAATAVLYLIGDGLLLWAVRRNLALVKGVVTALRLELAERILLNPGKGSEEEALGRIHTVLVQDAERIDDMSAALLCRIVPALLSVGVLSLVLVTLSPALFLVAAAILPAAWLLTTSFRRRVRRRVGAFHVSMDDYDSGVIRLLERIELTRTHGAEEGEIGAHRALAGRLGREGRSVAWYSTALLVLQNQTSVLTAIAVICVGHALVVSGNLTLGTLLTFYVVLAMMRSHLASIATQVPSVVAGKAALARFLALVGTGRANPYRGTERVDFSGHVDLADVEFSYGGEPLLSGVDLAIRPAAVTALVGPNGSGKTSIARLVLALEAPVRGTLSADGVPYHRLDTGALRSRVGFVSQDPAIFAGTVRENLTFGLAREAGPEEIERALEIAGARFVHQLDNGLESWLGDAGVRLSGGQRQRLSIARAVLRRPSLLILDEPTNHLGAGEAKAIIGRFRVAYPHSALLLISHDAEMLALADRVWRARPATAVSTAA